MLCNNPGATSPDQVKATECAAPNATASRFLAQATFGPTLATVGALAQRIAELRGETLFRNDRVAAVLREQVTPGSSVLDLGCGAGKVATLAKELAGNGRVEGVELVKGWVAAARNHTRSVVRRRLALALIVLA